MLFWVPLLSAGVPGSSELLSEDIRYSGVAKLSVAGSCTGSWIIPREGAPEDAPAYLFSAGHCYSTSFGTSELVRNREIANGVASFRYFIDTPAERRVTVPVRRVVWASMANTDVAVFELGATVSELRRQGLSPLTLGDHVEDELIVRGIPVSGTPIEDQYLREAGCQFQGVFNLIEFVWTFRRFLRHDCADIRGGSSGSPVINRRSGEVVGVMSTTVEGESSCYLGTPCVIGGEQPEVLEGSYSAPVWGWNVCFAADGRFDPEAAGCPLETRAAPVISGAPPRTIRQGRSWNVSVSGRYRYGTIAERDGFCEHAAMGGWREGMILDPIPDVEGGYFLCVEAENGAVAMRHVRVDKTPPLLAPRFTFADENATMVLRFEFSPAELSSYSYKFGAGADCHAPEGYLIYRRVPVRITGAGRLCLYGEDEAGNRTPPQGYDYGQGARIYRLTNGASLRESWLAPGAFATVFGTGLRGASVTIVDHLGVRHTAKVLATLPSQVNFYVPEAVRLGRAYLEVAEASVETEVRSASPGLFFTNTEGLEQYGTGMRFRPDAEGFVGGLRVRLQVEPLEEGLDRVRFLLPDDLKLRGFVSLWVRIGEWESNRMVVRLR
jgi:hypothetical protein